MQVVLVMFRSDGERRSFSVVRNMTVIGRREDCDLRIPVGDVSRKHCRLVRTDEGIRLEDLGSSNGTSVNGEPIKEMELNAGDTIGVGPVQFVVQIDGVPAEEDLVAPAPQPVKPAAMEGTMVPAGSLSGSDVMAGSSLHQPPPRPPGDDFLEDDALEELPVEEVSLEASTPGHPGDFEPASAEAAVAGTDDLTIDEDPLDFPLEEVESVETRAAPAPAGDSVAPLAAATEPEEEFQLELDPEPVASAPVPSTPARPLPVPPPVPATAAKPAAPTDDGDWDFMVEETEPEQSHTDFHINLESHHEQPHT